MRNYIAQSTELTTKTKRERAGSLIMRGLIGTAAVAAVVGALSGTAAAQPTDANVGVTSSIAMTGLTPNFTLTGLPGATVTGTGVVTFNVATNNLAGYAVTVQSQTATMAPGTVGNPDSVPVGALTVRESGTTPYTALSDLTAVTVHTQATRSAETGDELSNDYEVAIPFVNADTYSATLDYITTTL